MKMMKTLLACSCLLVLSAGPAFANDGQPPASTLALLPGFLVECNPPYVSVCTEVMGLTDNRRAKELCYSENIAKIVLTIYGVPVILPTCRLLSTMLGVLCQMPKRGYET